MIMRTHPWLAGWPAGIEYWWMWMPRSLWKLNTHRMSHCSPGGESVEMRRGSCQLKL